MCSWLRTTVPLAAALIVLSAGAASAQDALIVKVPFAFEVKGRTLPAGQYRVEQEQGLLTIRGEHGTRGNVFVLGRRPEATIRLAIRPCSRSSVTKTAIGSPACGSRRIAGRSWSATDRRDANEINAN